jgi:hypothetical protein
MPIPVTCPSCLKRFTVGDKFAGQTGPCPNCRKPIKIPEKTEEVVIHAPEPTGPKDSKGRSVLKPIRRKEFNVSLPVMIGAGLSTLIVFGLALGIRFSLPEPPTALLVIGALLLAPPLVFVGYWFLQDDELEGFAGKELWIRSAICSVAFAATWALYSFIPSYLSGYQSLADFSGTDLLIMVPIMITIGTIVAVLTFELEAIQGLLHYMLYLSITVFLALIMGTKLASPFASDTTISNPRGSQGGAPEPAKALTPPNQTQPAATPSSPDAKAPSEAPKPKINILQ